MKFFYITFSLIALSACSRSYYKNNFSEKASRHKIIAVLPFEFSVDFQRLPRNVSPALIAEWRQAYAVQYQENMYTWLLHRRQRFTVDLQDTYTTNQLLKNAGITPDSVWYYDKTMLAKTLKVDAVIIGKVSSRRIMSNEMAGVIATAADISTNTNDNLRIVPTNNAIAQLRLFDGESGSVIWNTSANVTGTVVNSPENLVHAVMNRSSKRFPYTSGRIARNR